MKPVSRWWTPRSLWVAVWLCALAFPVCGKAGDGLALPQDALNILSGGSGFLPEGFAPRSGQTHIIQEDGKPTGIALLNYGTIDAPGFSLTARNILLRIQPDGAVELYAEGDVVFRQDGQGTIYCDRFLLDYPEFRGLATGVRVRSERPPEEETRSFLAQAPSAAWRLDNSFDGGDLDFGAPGAQLNASALEMRIHDRYHVELIDVSVSADPYAEPHYRFHLPAAILRRYEKIEAYHSTLRIGNVPIFYLPYFVRDLRYDWPWMRFSAGSHSDWGLFAKTTWGFDLPTQPETWRYMRPDRALLNIDAYGDRGLGLGGAIRYVPQERVGPADERVSFGSVGGYAVFENWISADDDWFRARFKNLDSQWRDDPRHTPTSYRGDTRGTLFWNHYQELDDRWSVIGDLRYYSDRDMPWEYDRERYESSRPSRAALTARRLDDDWALTFHAQKRVNSWQTQSEYLPEVRAAVPGFQLFENLPLYWVQDARVGVVNRRFDKDLERYGQLGRFRDGFTATGDVVPFAYPMYSTKGDDDFGHLFRAYGETRLEAPVTLADALVVKPWVGARYAYYSDTYGDPVPYALLSPTDQQARREGRFTPGQVGESGGEFTGALQAGLDLSTRTYMFFGEQENWRLMLDPTVGYTANRAPSRDAFTLFPIDDAEDYDKESYYKAGFYGRLQSRTGAAPRDVLTFSAFFRYYPVEADRWRMHHGRAYSEISLDALWRITPKLSVWGNALLDPVYGRFNRLEGGADWWVGDSFRIYAKHLRLEGDPLQAADFHPPFDETVLAVRTKLWNDNSRYSAELAMAYDWGLPGRVDAGSRVAEYRVSLFRNMWDDFELAFSYGQNRRARDAADGGKIDHGFQVTFQQTGLAAVRRPGPVSSLAASHIAGGRYAHRPDAEANLNAEAAAILRDEAERRRALPAGAPGFPPASGFDPYIGGVPMGVTYY